MSWLLKTVAIEMKVTGANQQLSQLASIVEVYTGDQKQNDNDIIDQSLMLSGCKLVYLYLRRTVSNLCDVYAYSSCYYLLFQWKESKPMMYSF